MAREFIRIEGAREHNLKNPMAFVPCGELAVMRR